MLTRKSIDTVLLSVGAEKLSQREWDWMKMLKPMDPTPRSSQPPSWSAVATQRPLPCYGLPGSNPSSCCLVLLPAR